MKKIFYIFLFITSNIFATNYYVATTGNDATGNGSIGTPWADPEFGCQQLSAGDTLFLRGGTYYGVENDIRGDGNGDRNVLYINGDDARWSNGTETNPIVIASYPDERVILDGSNLTTTYARSNIYLIDCDYWYLYNIETTNANSDEGAAYDRAHGFYFQTSTNCKFDQCKSYRNEGYGFMIYGTSYPSYASCDGCSIINCDAYDNYDEYSYDPGNVADGISITGLSPADTIHITGCRTWANSDDGIDINWTGAKIYIDSCWSWSNGNYGGNGHGIKTGHAYDDGSAIVGEFNRWVTRCLVFYNTAKGIMPNSATVGLVKLYNNTVYSNGPTGWIGIDYSSAANTASIFRNNICDESGASWDASLWVNSIEDHNSWNIEPQTDATVSPHYYARTDIISGHQFASIDSSGVSGARQSDGTLPEISFLHLASGSAYINSGVDVGLSYSVSPDLGAFESSPPLPPPAVGYKLTGGDGKILTDGNGKIIIGR